MLIYIWKKNYLNREGFDLGNGLLLEGEDRGRKWCNGILIKFFKLKWIVLINIFNCEMLSIFR